MTNNTFLDYAKSNALKPVAWFGVDYPSYAIKVKYKYPTSNPVDFRDRAILQLIDKGISYSTVCSLLMINDPHQTILQRFKSDNPGPQLLHFDKEQDRLALTPIGRQRVESIELARDGVSCCYIDGFTGNPFPVDVVDNLADRYTLQDIKALPGGAPLFVVDIERRILELNTKVSDGKGHEYQKRLGIPAKARGASMSVLESKWVRNFSIGIFLRGSEIVRRIFCDDKATAISPFGWLEKISAFKLSVNKQSNRFEYAKYRPEDDDIFIGDSKYVEKLIMTIIKKEYGDGFIKNVSLSMDPDTSVYSVKIDSLEGLRDSRQKALSMIENGRMSIPLPGLIGCIFMEVKAGKSICDLSRLRREIDNSDRDWHDLIAQMTLDYPDNWRQTLIDIGRHDLLFRHDVEQYIRYGK